MGSEPIIGQAAGRPQIQLDINTIDNEKCGCGSELWTQAIVLKKVSSLISPSGKDELGNIPVVVCFECHAPYKTFQKLVSTGIDPS